jgi:hypothetical protein
VSANPIDLVQAILAFTEGRAMPAAGARQVAVRDDLRVLCPLVLAGEDVALHAIAVGALGQPPAIRIVPDPRDRAAEAALLGVLARYLEAYYRACRQARSFPQLWVPCAAAVDQLALLAERYRFARADAGAKRLGQLLTYPAERATDADQQCLVSATGALRRHWITGQDPAADEHLGALLAWIAPPPGRPLAEVVGELERLPAGTKTDPEFDRRVLYPLVSAYGKARRRGATRAELVARAGEIRAALEPVVGRIHRWTQEAIALLDRLELPDLPDLPELERREAAAFDFFMAGLDAGYVGGTRDTPRAAVQRFVAREDAAENVAAALRLGDPVERARALLEGRVIRGVVRDRRSVQVGRRRIIEYLAVLTQQRVLHARVRDTLVLADDPRLRLEVREVRRGEGGTTLDLEVTRGQRSVPLPTDGETIELAEAAPDWGRLGRTRGKLADRLASLPWTHSKDPLPDPRPAPAVPHGEPLLAEIEARSSG